MTNLQFAQIPVDGLVIGVHVILNLLGVQLNDNYDLLTNTKTVLYRLLMAVFSSAVSSFSCLFSWKITWMGLLQMPKSNKLERSRPVVMLKVNIIVNKPFSLRCTRRIQLSSISKSGKLFWWKVCLELQFEESTMSNCWQRLFFFHTTPVWYRVSIGRFWLVLGGTRSLWGGTRRYLVVLG